MNCTTSPDRDEYCTVNPSTSPLANNNNTSDSLYRQHPFPAFGLMLPRPLSYSVPLYNRLERSACGNSKHQQHPCALSHFDMLTGGPIEKVFETHFRQSKKQNSNKLTFQGKIYNFLERPTGWKCFVYHFSV